MSQGRKSFRVLRITLATGESLPTLVNSTTWLPVQVATRYAVRYRRFNCMDSTLERELRGIAELYEWAAFSLQGGLDQMLAASTLPSASELSSFCVHLRNLASRRKNSLRKWSTVAITITSIRAFLSWALDPPNQGSSYRKPIKSVIEERRLLEELFRPFERATTASSRIQPLSVEQVATIRDVAGPLRDSTGRVVLPVAFDDRNPFKPESRVRNWVMLEMARQCGFRRGELLKLRLDDLPKADEPGLKLRRRPHDPSDSRRHKPRVKTSERVIPLSDELRFGLRLYLSSGGTSGRKAGQSPYLYVSSQGKPLAISSADGITNILAKKTGILGLSWHSFRHTWAEELAECLLAEYPQERVFELLRELGGWRTGSNTPMHYIQNALRKFACDFLVERNGRLYSKPEANP